MPIYRFRILDIHGRVVAGQYNHRENDDAARNHADILDAYTMRMRGLSIEIWNGGRQVPRKHPVADRIAKIAAAQSTRRG
jgi:hypothetical protein